MVFLSDDKVEEKAEAEVLEEIKTTAVTLVYRRKDINYAEIFEGYDIEGAINEDVERSYSEFQGLN